MVAATISWEKSPPLLVYKRRIIRSLVAEVTPSGSPCLEDYFSDVTEDKLVTVSREYEESWVSATYYNAPTRSWYR